MAHEKTLNVDVSKPRRTGRFGLALVVAAAIGWALLGQAPQASAAATCSIVGNIGFVVATGDGPVVISRDAGGNFSAIRVNGASCGNLSLVSKMVIQPAAGNQDIVIDQTNGLFQPGLGGESGGIAELEFEIDGGAGTDSLKVIGRSVNDAIAFGSNGVALNTDADTDVTKAVGIESFVAEGRAGVDLLTGAGNTNGTTGAFNSALTFLGGAGNDALRGGTSASDVADFSTAPGGIVVDLGAGAAAGDGTDTLTAIEGVNGTPFNDIVTFKPDRIEVARLQGGNDTCKQVSRGVNDGGVEGDTCDGGPGRDKYDATGILRNSPGISVDFINDIVNGSGPDHIPGVEDTDTTNGEDEVIFQPDEINNARMMGGDDTCKQKSRGVNDGGVEGDTCDGGSGTDTYDGSGIEKNSPGISIDFINGVVNGSGPDFIPFVENGIGTNGEDEARFKPDQINVVRLLGGDDVCKQNSRGVNDGGVEGDTCDGGPGRDKYDATGILRNSPGISVDFINDIVNGSGPDHIPGVEDTDTTNGEDEVIFQPDEINNARMMGGDDTCKQKSRGVNDGGVEGDTCDGGSGTDTYDGSGIEKNSPGISIDFINGVVNGSGPDFIPFVENGIGTNGEDEARFKPDQINVVRLLGGDDVCKQNSRGVNDGGVEGDTCDGGPGRDKYDATGILRNSPGISVDFINDIVNGSGPDHIPGVEDTDTTNGEDEVIFQPDEINNARMMGGDDTCKQKSRGVNDGGVEGDTCDGGSGIDTYDASGVLRNSPGISMDFLNNIVTGSGPDFVPGVENGIGTNGDDNFIDANNDCNVVRGGSGDDSWLAGSQRPGSENDPQRGQCGDDVDLGEGGEVLGDLLDYTNTVHNSPGVVIDMVNGVVSGSPEDKGGNSERARGSGGDDKIVGNSDDNILEGGEGNDVISGGGGEDQMDGGAGFDTLTSSGGDDGVTCDSGQPQAGEGDSATSFEGCQGGSGNDVIYGTSGNDTLSGGGGNDQIFGLQGDDIIDGGDGDDFMDGGNGNDTLSGGAGNDEIHGGSNGGDTLTGGPGDDQLFGGNGPDSLDGQDDNDSLDGGEGPDSCTGETETNCET